jgi:cobalt-precorrin-5B (C1)-methyltransferase
MPREAGTSLRRGWTTGACAAGAARAAFAALLSGQFPDPVSIRLPRGGLARFQLALGERCETSARAGILKDAGDDPDITHGALVIAEIAPAPSGSGIGFAAGEGVGTVTRAGLALAVGEPAINPGPRTMIRDALTDEADEHGASVPDVTVTISIPGGDRLAEKTMNARLGIIGGLSILGTTGIVIPYSCSSWIHSIQRGIDVARAAGLEHIAATTGSTSERAVQQLYALPDHALIDMGDFVGGVLKYLRTYPIDRLTIVGGFAKLTKLADGHLDLHSAQAPVDTMVLARRLAALGADPNTVETATQARGAGEVLAIAGDWRPALADDVARRAREVALATLGGKTAIEVAVVDRHGDFIARVGG